MLDKVLIIDFDDSFTYNIANVLYPFEKKIQVISHKDFFHFKINEVLQSRDFHAIILGPGPGHPIEFQIYFEQISTLRKKENIYIMGICLGHQVLGLLDGKTVDKALEQLHGQTTEIEFFGKNLKVQRYNSLAVYEDGIELNMRVFKNGISYQFHPESIGTDSNELFFQDLLNFIK